MMSENPYNPPTSRANDRQLSKRGIREALSRFFSIGMGLVFAMVGLALIASLVRIAFYLAEPDMSQAFQTLWDLKTLLLLALIFIAIGLVLIWFELRSHKNPSHSDSVEPPSPQ